MPVNGTVNIQGLVFTNIPPLTITSITLATAITTFTTIGEQAALFGDGVLSDGTQAVIDGTQTCAITYRSTNSDVVSVDENETATAVGPGIALVSASTEGLTAVTTLTVSPGDPLTAVAGLVHLADGSGVKGADVALFALGRSTVTDGNGAFMLADVPTQLGDIHAVATTTIGGKEFYGAARFVEAVGGGFADAGIITLSDAIRWVKPNDGSWANIQNWEIFSPPGVGQKAVIDVPDAEITVTHDDTVPFDGPIGDLLCNERLRLEFDTLSVGGLFQMNNTLEMACGQLVNSTINLGPGALINMARAACRSRLDGVTINGNMDLINSGVRILNGLTINGDVRLAGGTGSTAVGMSFQGAVKFLDGNGTVAFLNNPSSSSIRQVDGGSLRIASGITIRGAEGRIGTADAPLVHDGVIHSDTSGTIEINGLDWINNGTLRVSGDGSELLTRGSWTNNGAVEATGAGRLILGDSWQNLGTLTVTDADVRLDHEFTIAELGTFSFVNSLVVIEGTFTNGTNLVLDANRFHWRLGGGTVVGGTISSADGTTFDVVQTITGGIPTLDGVTLDADMRFLTGGTVLIRNGLTLNSTIPLNGYTLSVDAPNRTIDGTGRIEFLSSPFANSVIQADPRGANDFGVMTIGPGITIAGGVGRVGPSTAFFGAPASLINQGTIHSDRPGIILVDGTDWVNNGVLKSSGDGGVRALGAWTNNGTVHAGANSPFESLEGYTQSSAGTMLIDIAGIAAGDVGRLSVTGTAIFAGTMRVEFTDGFMPSAGQSFTVVEHDGHSGVFASIEAPSLGGDLVLVPSYELTRLVLTVAQP